MLTYLLCVVGGLLAVLGDVLFKRWADYPTHPLSLLLFGLLVYSLDACVWALVLRRGIFLSTGAVAWSSTGLMAAIAAGLLFFNEQPTPVQWAGLLLGIGSIALLSWTK